MRLLILLCTALVMPLHAADIPQGSQRDNRIQYVNYHSGDVVLVHSAVGIVSRIVFEQGEIILPDGIHTGHADGWDITGRGRILTIQPMSVQLDQETTIRPNPKQWGTNIAIETNKRLYDFEVRLLPENYSGHDAQMFYRIEFSYPIESEANARTIATKNAAAAAQAAKAEQAILPKPRNSNYTMRLGKRSDGIAPTMAFDDGLFTYLRFPNNRDIPTVWIVTADGTEGKINTHVHEHRRDILVVHRVARELILRLGSSVVAISNQSFDIDGMPPVDGSSTPTLRRITRGGSL